MRATTSLTAALTLSAFLAACSADDDQPTVLATLSPAPAVTSADSSASATVDPPVMPPEADAQTAAGAMAFARHYFALMDYAYATGDTAPLAALSVPECAPCAAVRDLIDDAVAVGDSYEGSPTIISDVSVPEPDTIIEAVNVLLESSGSGKTKIHSDGSEEPAFEAYSGVRLRMVLVLSGGHWQIRNYGEIA